MFEINITILLASVVAGATPIILAAIGETFTEKAGIVNLSLDGAILLSAMVAFAVSYETGSILLGLASGALAGAAVAGIVAFFSIYLEQSQVAVGFALTLMTRDLAYFLGNPYSRQPGPQIAPLNVPFLKDLPFFGQVFFSHNLFVYFALALIGFSWWYMYRTRPGLNMISVGEHPGASYARGIDPRKIQFFYSICGGLLVGLAGAAFSLSLKPGWGRPQGAEGTGWIVLAIVIFGGWNPIKVAAGAFFFSLLQVMGIYFQGWFPSIPAQVFQVAPFPLMIFTLLLMNIGQKESMQIMVEEKPLRRFMNSLFSGAPPRALGRAYRPD
jgi:ABC-type uncharacterized transport system permease subunit